MLFLKLPSSDQYFLLPLCLVVRSSPSNMIVSYLFLTFMLKLLFPDVLADVNCVILCSVTFHSFLIEYVWWRQHVIRNNACQTRHNFVGEIRIFSLKICLNPYPSFMHR